MKRIKIIGQVISLLILVFPSSAHPQASTSEVWEKTLSVDPSRPTFFSFRDVNGDLVVITHEEPTLKIKVKKEASTTDQRLTSRLLSETKIQINQRDNQIDLEIIYPRLRSFFLPLRDYRRVKVSTVVSLPQGTNLKANLGDGRASLKGKLREVNVTTVDGSIWLEAVEGLFNLKTVDGRITIQKGKGQAEIVSVDGDIIIEGEIEPINIKTTDGDIRINLLPGVKITRPWNLKTIDGDIEISLTPDLSADLSLETVGGSIRCDLKLTLSEIRGEKNILGRLNQGGPLISLQSIDGHLWIKQKLMENTQL
ncbi:MAG: DUF4097 domain-containing protein [Candidatus Aminicenantes bacterium]|nr:DUF4097 domain-containing protein [Candidatus Aminicenantes bacterium]